jgi:hypothetical protein
MRKHRRRRQPGETLPGAQQPQDPASRLAQIRYLREPWIQSYDVDEDVAHYEG